MHLFSVNADVASLHGWRQATILARLMATGVASGISRLPSEDARGHQHLQRWQYRPEMMRVSTNVNSASWSEISCVGHTMTFDSRQYAEQKAKVAQSIEAPYQFKQGVVAELISGPMPVEGIKSIFQQIKKRLAERARNA
jgi:hypothetical protein